jgi:uncharacterized membrane protein
MLAVLNIAAAIWVGSIVFQSFLVAPTVFRHVDDQSAGRFLRAIFPRFYKLGMACGAAMLGAVTIALLTGLAPGPGMLPVAIVIMTAAQLISLRMLPSINAARDAGEAGRLRFKRLHAVSVGLTLLTLALGVGVLTTLVWTPA